MLAVALGILLTLLLLSVPVAATLIILALILDWGFTRFPLYRGMGEVLWSASDSFLLIAIPMFISARRNSR